jgi:hypothetical protein
MIELQIAKMWQKSANQSLMNDFWAYKIALVKIKDPQN